MANPVPNVHIFSDGDDFDSDESLGYLNDNFLMMGAKFGALTAEDLLGGALDVLGAVDMRTHKLDNVVEALGIVNMKEKLAAGLTLAQVMSTMTSGGVLYIPPGTSCNVTSPLQMKDDVHIVGGGRGSVINATSQPDAGGPWPMAGYNVIEDAGARRWSIRHLRIIHKAGGFYNTGHGISITNLGTAADVVVENVHFGPNILSLNLTNAIPEHAISVDTSENIRIYSCRFVETGDSAIYLKGSTNIQIDDCHSHEAGSRGIEIENTDWTLIRRNRIQQSSLQSVFLNGGSHLVLHENGFYNAVTAPAGTQSNVYGTLTKAITIHENHFEDIAGEPRVSTKFQIDHLAGASAARNMILTANWFGDTTNTESLGYSVSLGESLFNVLVSVTDESGFVKDENTITTYEQARYNKGGWPGGYRTSWYAVTNHPADPDGPAGFQQIMREDLVNPGAEWPDGLEISKPHFYGMSVQFSDTGLIADGKQFNFTEILKRIANPGSLLTPAVLYTGHSHIDDEIAAAHATFNVYERKAGVDDQNPSGLVTGNYPKFVLINGAKKTIQGAIDSFLGMWGYTYSGTTFIQQPAFTRRQNVLAIYTTSGSPYPTTDGDDGQPNMVVIRSGLSEYSVTPLVQNVSYRCWYPRPTFATIHL